MVQPHNTLWRLPTVLQETGLSKSEIYRRIKLNTFPKPLKLGVRAVAWPAVEIQSWVQSLIHGAAK
ncbi:AlpA family transcriptional regulator [Undibacterium jejuense]|uniref:AlpA family transcriptional regulator n=1 Tax=Undibacterium jejuense TaxID=1344949 RepID=A0A923KRV1_9BURK|nr:AlpA family transcriptional regulator [Undibacterium jejuense]MBC3864359.1 AlpA family transcriptional regulator [Undibacterium jejuense]